MKEYGRRFKQFNDFCLAVKLGKKPIIVSCDYVVISREMFDKLQGTKQAKKVIEMEYYDEWAELTREQFEEIPQFKGTRVYK